jgi:hypothetical protein
MQHGSLIKSVRKFGPDVWQFRRSEKDPQNRRIYWRMIGTVEDYRYMDCARRAVVACSRKSIQTLGESDPIQ